MQKRSRSAGLDAFEARSTRLHFAKDRKKEQDKRIADFSFRKHTYIGHTKIVYTVAGRR